MKVDKEKGWIYILLAILLTLLFWATIGCKRPIPSDAKLLGTYQLRAARVIPDGWELKLGNKIIIRTFSGFFDPALPQSMEIDGSYDVYEKSGNYYVQKTTRRVNQ